MTSIESVIIEVADMTAAKTFYTEAFGLEQVHLREADAPTTGFRGYTLSLTASQPGNVDAFIEAALAGGATSLKSATKSFWGYGGVVRAPDGAIWKIASSSKKDTEPSEKRYDEFVLLLGVEDMVASKQFYVEHGFEVGKSYGRKYTEFASAPGSVKLALYPHKALAKDLRVLPEGSGSHRLAIVSDAEPFIDLDGFAWETVSR